MYIIRMWVWDEASKQFRIAGSSHNTIDEAEEQYSQIKMSGNVFQKELIEEECDGNGNIIYENQLRIDG